MVKYTRYHYFSTSIPLILNISVSGINDSPNIIQGAKWLMVYGFVLMSSVSKSNIFEILLRVISLLPRTEVP